VRLALGIPNFQTRKAERRREKIARAIALHPEFTNQEIAEATGESAPAVRNTRTALRLPPAPSRRGENLRKAAPSAA